VDDAAVMRFLDDITIVAGAPYDARIGAVSPAFGPPLIDFADGLGE
jgi:hypothetical protein